MSNEKEFLRVHNPLYWHTILVRHSAESQFLHETQPISSPEYCRAQRTQDDTSLSINNVLARRICWQCNQDAIFSNLSTCISDLFLHISEARSSMRKEVRSPWWACLSGPFRFLPARYVRENYSRPRKKCKTILQKQEGYPQYHIGNVRLPHYYIIISCCEEQ